MIPENRQVFYHDLEIISTVIGQILQKNTLVLLRRLQTKTFILEGLCKRNAKCG